MKTLNIKGLDKPKLLASLYNHSRVQGMGRLELCNQEQMDIGRAIKIWNGAERVSNNTYFDYLQGRVLKVDIGGDTLDPYLYDRDNGSGAAAKAIARVRQGFHVVKDNY